MPVELPQLNGSRFESLSVCAVFPADSVGLAEFSPQEGTAKYESKYGPPDGVCYIQHFADRFPTGEFHFHVNIVPAKSFGDSPPATKSDLQEIKDRLGVFSGKHGDVVISGRYKVRKEHLPKHGVALGLSGISTQVSGEELSLVGATLSISGHPYDRLSWKVSDEDVEGRLAASLWEATVEESYLLTALSTLESGIDRFLLEKASDE